MRITRIVFTAILATGTGLVAASPAEAAQNCGSGDICLYDSSVSASPFHFRDGADTGGECHAVSPAITSWVRNQTSHAWTFYTTGLCGGWVQTVNAGTSAAMNSQTNNQVRSYKRR